MIEQRGRLGDLEGDTVSGPPATGGVITMVDRLSRRITMTKITRKNADHEEFVMRLKLLPFIALVFPLCFPGLQDPRAAADEPLRISGLTMGSHYAIVIDSPGSANATQLQEEIEADFADISRQMSTWDNSEISQFNRSSSTDWFAVGKDFAVVVQEAKRIHELSEGALDPTLAPLIDAWGFGVKKNRRAIPTDTEISNALKNVGMQHLEVRTDSPAIREAIPWLQLTLSSIAPGYAADEVCRILRSHGLTSHVVDVGGENRTGKAKANGGKWRVGVESPMGGDLQKMSIPARK